MFECDLFNKILVGKLVWGSERAFGEGNIMDTEINTAWGLIVTK